ncbi:MAG: sulfite exporter TauE/SafE family protein [Alcanivorax sp.]|nr:sulfite exporter TauE/SafE family protein [Alcanivorax sp.]
MDWTLWLVMLAAFFGGALNAVAGGGSFLTLPALLVVGVPPVVANATGTLALLPGYLASCLGYRRELRHVARDYPVVRLLLVSLLGGTVGALLLLATSNTLFRALVPWLLLLATLLFVIAPIVLRRADAVSAGWLLPGLLLVAIYGGYFNGGLGILLMALFALAGMRSLQHANALKNLVSALLTVVAVLVYSAGSAIDWRLGVPMMISATLGGYAGACWGRYLPDHLLRRGIIGTGLVMAVLFMIY